MFPMLLRRSSRIVFALLCVLVLTRMPLVCSAEESAVTSVKIEEGVAVAADVTPRTVEILPPAPSSVFAPHVNADARETNTRLIEYSILRL
jgi:hypothetical protein